LVDPSAAPGVNDYLARAESVILPSQAAPGPRLAYQHDGDLYAGVDLGTAYLVLVVLDRQRQPVAGEYQFAEVVRDGLVVDFIGAIDRLKAMKERLEQRLGRQIVHAASGYPPGVARVEVRATASVVEAAGFECSGLVDEPSAANNVLHIRSGAIVDVGGGTTGIAVVKDGQVVYTADEPTGGTHFSLVIAGALGISFEEAEELKIKPSEQARLFPLVRPVMEKVASIIDRHVAGQQVDHLTLVGGTTAFPGMAGVIQEYTGLPTQSLSRPLFVTPLGIALHDASTVTSEESNG
jgi:ethanolamine utilization protein EutJ